jgi:hypothetical protein
MRKHFVTHRSFSKTHRSIFRYLRIISAIVLSCNLNHLSSQTFEWVGMINGGYIASVSHDPFENLYCGGTTTSSIPTILGLPFGNFPHHEAGLILKLKPDKSIDWYKSFPSNTINSVVQIIYSTHAGLWISGQFIDSISLDGYTFYSPLLTSHYIAKLDPQNGTVLWASAAIASNQQQYFSMSISNHGDIVVSSSFEGTFNFLNQTVQSTGQSDIAIMKLDKFGNWLWTKQINGSGTENISTVTKFDNSGDMYLSGKTYSSNTLVISGTTYQLPATTGDLSFILKLDTQGNLVWINYVRGSFNSVSDVMPDHDGNLYFIGTIMSAVNFGPIYVTFPFTGHRGCLGKLNSLGQFCWVKHFGTNVPQHNHTTILTTLNLSSDNNIYVGGSFYYVVAFDSFVLSTSGSDAQLCMAKTDTSGNVIWANNANGNGYSMIHNISLSDSENIIALGTISGTHYLGNFQCVATNQNNNGFISSVTKNANRITGRLFFDQNSSGVFDAGDIPIPGKGLHINNTQGIYLTNTFGQYNCFVGTGTYSVVPPSTIQYYTLNSLQPANLQFQSWGLQASCDLTYIPVSYVNDLELHLTAINAPSLTNPVYYRLDYINRGTNPIPNASIQCILDTGMTLISTNPPASHQHGDTLIWDLGYLNLFANGYVEITSIWTSFGNAGDSVHFNAEISPVQGDTTPENNTCKNVSFLLMAYDPNYKEVSIESLYPDELLATPWLVYTIHFQNLGNAPAKDVVIIDTFSNLLNLPTIEMLAASHEYEFNIEGNGVGKFRFKNIILPDSASDPIGSCGFVKFQVKPNSQIPSGNTIQNVADIYFDFNEPVRTNWANTYISYPLQNMKDLSDQIIKIFPNPVYNGQFSIQLPSHSGSANLKMYSTQGKLLKEQSWSDIHNLEILNIQNIDLPPGIYFCVFATNDNIYYFRVLNSTSSSQF